MDQTLVVSKPAAPRRLVGTHEICEHVPLAIVEVTVPGTSSAACRQALRSALGTDLHLYLITVDKRQQNMTFRVEAASCSVDDVIAALTRALGEARIGRAKLLTNTRPAPLKNPPANRCTRSL
jgi:hypothetical protein